MIKKILNKVFYAVVIALVFAFINRCNVKALNNKDILLDIPNTDIQAAFTVDIDTYPYYYGIMRADTSNGIFKVDFYYSAEQLFYGSLQSTTCGLNSGYEENPCYGYLTKSTSTVPVYHFYKYYYLDNGHLSSANNEPEIVSRSSMFGYFILATYNFSDYVEYATSWGGYNSYGFPLIIDYSIPWVASSDIYDKNDHNILILTTQYINELIHPDINYKIEYSAINSTNNSQEIFGNDNTITGAGIAIKYLPLDNTLYNYYYYWEKDEGQEPIGDPNDITDWQQLDSSDKGIGVVVVDSNGWLYAKITDKNGNMLANNVLNYKAYGKTSLFPSSYVKTDTWLGKFADQINYGGPINSIITVPINLLNTLFQSFNGTCQSFNMGAILGKNITFNCFTLQSILGSDITSVIDMIFSFVIYYHLILFIISIYRKIINLEELQDYLGNNEEYDLHE